MAYTPPVGSAPLHIGGVLGYTPPVGNAPLHIGHTESADRTVTVSGETLAPIGLLAANVFPAPVVVSIAGETLPPIGLVTVQSFPAPVAVVVAGETLPPIGLITGGPGQTAIPVTISGETLPPIGLVTVAYDPNLLRHVVATTATRWAESTGIRVGVQSRQADALPLRLDTQSPWRDATPVATDQRATWADARQVAADQASGWNDANSVAGGLRAPWRDAPRVTGATQSGWSDATRRVEGVTSRFAARLPLVIGLVMTRAADGPRLAKTQRSGWSDGPLLVQCLVPTWRQAILPGNTRRSGPSIPVVVPTPWGTALHLRCPLPGARLRIGRTACILVPSREIPVQRTYRVLNSASLVRWPDLAPIPCKDLTIETDFNSWCWALTATLITPEAWPLVAPNPLACQVLATVNGLPWRFLLDVPNRTRSFNSDQVTIKGRSRSAWLHSPYLASADYSEANAREMQQLAEAALDNTGWSLDWQLENWVVPGGRYVGHNTPMGCLIRLANATDDGIYTAPDDQIITMYKRWPVASWLLDAAPVDLSVPMDAGYTLTESPVYTAPYNGVYVSGTSHGARVLVKIAGTDGALQPTDPITHELLCDTAGVAATQRGLNALSDSGAGFEATMEMQLLDEIGLIRPGLVVSIAGIKGVSRSCRIHAAWDASNGLTVTQTVGLERREVES